MVRPNRKSSQPSYFSNVDQAQFHKLNTGWPRFKAKVQYYLDQSMESPHTNSVGFMIAGFLILTTLALFYFLLHRAFHPHDFKISIADSYWTVS